MPTDNDSSSGPRAGLLRRVINRIRKPDPVYTCEICKAPGVRRYGTWDHCLNGHRYVGSRADDTTATL
jgi:hypothetical protein